MNFWLPTGPLLFAQPFLNTFWNQVKNLTESGPLSTPSADFMVARSTRSPPELCSIGEYAYGHHSPLSAAPRSSGVT